MPNINDMFPSKYLKAHELKGTTPTVTIDRVDFEQVRSRTGGLETKPVVFFRGKAKGLLLNKTNARSIAQIAHSAITEDWRGVTVAIYPTTDQFGKETYDVIRIKAPLLAAAPAAPRPVPSALVSDLNGDECGPTIPGARVALLSGLASRADSTKPTGGGR